MNASPTSDSPSRPRVASGLVWHGAWGDVDRIDAMAARDTPMHRLDPRAKILALAAFCGFVVSFPVHVVSALTPFALFPLGVASGGRVPVRFLARRLLPALPFLVAVGVANPWLDRRPALQLAGVAISGGWVSFASLLLRGLLTVSALLAVVACTGMPAFCTALRRLGVPGLVCGQVELLHRYLFVVGDEARRMHRAAILRCAAAGPSGTPSPHPGRARPPRLYVPLLGALLLRSMDRADRVHLAMLSRGHAADTSPPAAVAHAWTLRDTAFATGWLAFFALARHTNLAAALGRLLTGGAA